MKWNCVQVRAVRHESPLAEGRELKLGLAILCTMAIVSPLAEGRELK